MSNEKVCEMCIHIHIFDNFFRYLNGRFVTDHTEQEI